MELTEKIHINVNITEIGTTPFNTQKRKIFLKKGEGRPKSGLIKHVQWTQKVDRLGEEGCKGMENAVT